MSLKPAAGEGSPAQPVYQLMYDHHHDQGRDGDEDRSRARHEGRCPVAGDEGPKPGRQDRHQQYDREDVRPDDADGEIDPPVALAFHALRDLLELLQPLLFGLRELPRLFLSVRGLLHPALFEHEITAFFYNRL